MAQINNMHVDEAYSQMFVENLRQDNFLVEGVTYTSNFEKGDVKAGIVWYHKLARNTVGSEAVGGDYTHTETSDDLVPVYITNAFRNSKKLRGVVASQIKADYKDQVATEQAKDVKLGEDKTAIAGLVYGGTVSQDTADIDDTNVIEKIIDAKKDLKRKNATPNVLLVSPEVEAILTTVHLTKSIFTPVTNDDLVKAGVLGKYLGMYVFSRNELGDSANTAVVYRDSQARSVDLSTVEFVMYDSNYFAVNSSFEEARIADSNEFAGSYANIERNEGFGVLNADAVLVKRNA